MSDATTAELKYVIESKTNKGWMIVYEGNDEDEARAVFSHKCDTYIMVEYRLREQL